MKLPHIVLIEDNPADVLLIEMALKENGIACEITRFASGEEALRVLCGPDAAALSLPQAILLDLNTPRSDGFQVLIKLKQFPRFAEVPIALITSSQASSDKHRSRLQGTRYIEKPSQLEDFLTTIGQAVREMLHTIK
jgi:CheY-like chemotaxis protein